MTSTLYSMGIVLIFHKSTYQNLKMLSPRGGPLGLSFITVYDTLDMYLRGTEIMQKQLGY